MMFLRQFVCRIDSFPSILIEIAALVSLGVGDYTDFGIITAMLFINGCLGFREEHHAKKSLDEVSNSIDSEIATRRN
jgi:H+-transporting ATPase